MSRFHVCFQKDAMQCGIFHTRNQSWWMNVKDVSLYKDSDADTRRLMLAVSYTFNPKKSKYKGEGAANDEMKRL